METILILWITALVSLLALQWGEAALSRSHLWPQLPVPNPEVDPCAYLIPANSKSFLVSPLVEVDTNTDVYYPCDQTSKILEISIQGVLPKRLATCHGVVVTKGDKPPYEFVFPVPEHVHNEPWGPWRPWGTRNKNHENNWSSTHRRENITFSKFTQVRMWSNGNIHALQCGVIANGTCAGDIFTYFSVTLAADQNGCSSGDGNPGLIGIWHSIEIKGKCESRCPLSYLGRSVRVFAQPVANCGLIGSASCEPHAQPERPNEWSKTKE